MGAFSFLGIGSKPSFGNVPNYLNQPMNPELKGLQDQYQNLQYTPETKSYQAQDFSGALPEYDSVRDQAKQTSNTQNQGSQEALQRRFAAMGGLNSGSYIKASQMQDQSTAQNLNSSLNNIGFQEAQQRRQLQTQEGQKAYQSQEAVKGRNAQLGAQYQLAGLEGQSKMASLDLGYKQAQQEAAGDQYTAALNSYQALHTGGLLGSGGFVGTGIGA